MAMHGWRLWGATVAVATTIGLGLGAYVTSAPSAGIPRDAAALYTTAILGDRADSSVDTDTGDTGSPSFVRCRGCGPTLAERQMAANMAGLDADGMITGTQDVVVRDYLASEPSPDMLPVEPMLPPRSTAHQLHPSIARFAAGDGPALAPAAVQKPEGSVPPAVAPATIAPLP